MHKKLEKWIDEATWKALLKTKQLTVKMGVDIYSIELLQKIHRGYMKFLTVAFNIITMATFSLAITWFFPVYLHVPMERMILIMLVIIVLQLRYGKTQAKFVD